MRTYQAELGLVRAEAEQSAEVFSLEETKFLKRKTADTFNARLTRQSTSAHHLIKMGLSLESPIFIYVNRKSFHHKKNLRFFCGSPLYSLLIKFEKFILNLSQNDT